VFEACYAALHDHQSKTRRMHTVAAPPGAGKTTFSLAFITALTRYAEKDPEGAYGAVFLADRDERADEVYRELNALLPGDKVAVWTGSHGHLFKREALRQYPDRC
jgi:superfamily II DNA/RNA helicase